MNTEPAESFTDFVRSTEPRLKHALVAAFGTEVGVEATSEVLAFAWEHWESVRRRSNPAGYLYGVGRNKAKRILPRRTVFPAPPTGHEFWVEPGLPQALTRLSEKQRVAVLLIHGDQWTYSEVAGLLGVSVSTVQQHVERGMSKLRQAIGVPI